MANLSQLSTVTTAANALSNLILVTPQANKGYQAQTIFKDQTQDPPILFNYEGEQIVTLESDITDHYIEDNTSIQDQIAIKPIMISTHGFVGELNDVSPVALEGLKEIADKLVPIAGYLPTLSITAQRAYAQAAFFYATGEKALNAGVAAWSSIFGNVLNNNDLNPDGTVFQSGAQNKQQIYFSKFFGYWNRRTLFTIQTPWAIFKNAAIKTLRAIQDAETDVITDFEVVFKVIRFASTATVLDGSDPAFMDGRLADAASPLRNQGSSTPTIETSLLDQTSQVINPGTVA